VEVHEYKSIGQSFIVPAQQLIIFITEVFGPNPHISERVLRESSVKNNTV